MKKIALILLLGSLSPMGLRAHCGHCGIGNTDDAADVKAQSIDAELASMTEALSLDAAQQAKIKPVLEKCRNEKAKAMKGKNPEAQKCPAGYQKEIRKILNKDQQAKLDELSKGKPGCCPTPWTKCPQCAAKGGKSCCPKGGQKDPAPADAPAPASAPAAE